MVVAPEVTACPSCGTPYRKGTLFCPQCGHAVRSGDGTENPAPEKPGANGKPRSYPLPPRSGWRRKGLALGIALIVLAVGASVYFYEYAPGGPLNPYLTRVAEVLWTQGGAPLTTSPGFTVHAGKLATVSVQLFCAGGGFFGPTTCDSGSVYLLTPGFGLRGTNAPFTWSGGSGGATATVTVVLVTPPSSFSGNLAIDLH